MDIDALKDAVASGRIEWLKHSLERMFQRGIQRAEVIEALLHAEIVEDYPNDKPYSSSLVLGWAGTIPLHVVVAYDVSTSYVMVVTVYRPDDEHFEQDFKTRRSND